MDKLFNYFVRDTKDWMDDTINELSELHSKAHLVNEVFKKVDTDNKYKDASQEVEVYAANISRKFNDKLKDMNCILILSKTREDELEEQLLELQTENVKLTEQLKLTKYYDNSKLAESIVLLYNKLNEVLDNDTKDERIQALLDLVERNVNVLKTTEFMRSRKRDGIVVDSKPNFRGDVDTNDLIKDYLDGLKPPQLAVKYNMGENGIRERLKRANVWKSR